MELSGENFIKNLLNFFILKSFFIIHNFLVYYQTILTLLEKYPSAWAIKSAPLENIKQILSFTQSKRPLSVTAEEIKELAQNSTAHFFPIREQLLQNKIRELFFLEEQLERITELFKRACEEASLCQDIKLLKSIRGIGERTAMHFIVEVEDIRRFSSVKKLIAYCGLDPTVYESGKFKGKSKISKRGNRHLRRVIWLMAMGVSMHNWFFREYFKRRLAMGFPYKKAILAVAHKLLRIVYAILKHKRPFLFNHCESSCI